MIIQSNEADIYDFTALLINADDMMERGKEITIDNIINVVCSFYRIEPSKLNDKRKDRTIIRVRQLCHYYAHLLTKESLWTIGNKIGKRNHATVISSCKSISNLIETDPILRDKTIKVINSAFGIY